MIQMISIGQIMDKHLRPEDIGNAHAGIPSWVNPGGVRLQMWHVRIGQDIGLPIRQQTIRIEAVHIVAIDG